MKIRDILLIVIVSATFCSCFSSEKKTALTVSEAVQIDGSQASCPFVTTDENGNIVLSWIRSVDSSSEYCYAISNDEGKTFGPAVTVAGSDNIHPHGENMPKIIFKPDGEIIAAWASANANPKNAYSDLIYYTQSFDHGKTWTQRQRLVKDTAGYDQRYFDLALLPGGEAAIIWLDNRKAKNEDGSALYFASTKGNEGFQNEHLIAEPCCPCCRTDLFVDSKKDIHVLYRAILNDSIRDMVHSVSTDDGKSFSTPERISKDNWVIFGCPHTGPAMTESKNGMQFTWYTGGKDGGIYYCSSNDEGKSFTDRIKISGANSRHCQIASIGNQVAIVWNENFLSGDTSACRVGIEIRKQDGNTAKEYITPDGGDASFPVIKPLNNNGAFIAYTYAEGQKNYVKYQRVLF